MQFYGADCGSDQVPVTCKLRRKRQKLKKTKEGLKLQYARLLNDIANCKEM